MNFKIHINLRVTKELMAMVEEMYENRKEIFNSESQVIRSAIYYYYYNYYKGGKRDGNTNQKRLLYGSDKGIED